MPAEQKSVRLKTIFIHGILLTTPLLLYLYIPLIAPTTPYATLSLSDDQTLILYENSPGGFWNHVMGTVFTGDLQPAAAGPDRLLLTWQLFQQQFSWIGVLLALLGLLTLWRRQQFGVLILTGLGSLAFIIFNLIYFIGDVFVLFIPVWLIASLWVGVGGLSLTHWLAKRFVESKATTHEALIFKGMGQPFEERIYRTLVIFATVVLFLILVGLLAMRNLEVSQSHNTQAQKRWQEILAEPLPQNAILISNDRNEIMPMWYYQYVEQRRPDLLGLFPLIVTDAAYSNVGRVLDQALASGRPVYLIKPMDELRLKADLTPAGTLYKVTTPSESPGHQLNIPLPEVTVSQDYTEGIILLGYDLMPKQATPGEAVTVTLYWQVKQALSINYTSYVHLINDEGQGITQNDHQPGGDVYPSSFWQPAEILRDRHTLTLPDDLPPGVYQFRVGLYYQPEPGVFAGMGPGEVIGQLTIF